MNRNVKAVLLMVLCGSALAAGGCTKKDMVKADGQIAPAATTAAGQAPVHTEQVQETPVQAEIATPAEQSAQLAKEPLNRALDNIYFNFDSSVLSPEATASLAKAADLLKREATTRIRIEGNCDERGSDEYNLALGDRRANAARQYLVTIGISADRLSTVSYGREKPADPGHNEDAWAKNRRDEFVAVSP
jgi:peptidoglycan-associated lipoprotein